MYYIIVSFYLIIGYLIIKSKGLNRMFYLLLGLMYTPGNLIVIPNSLFTEYTFYASVFTISLLIHGEYKLKNFINCPQFKYIIFMFGSCLLIGLFDERLGSVRGMWNGILHFTRTFYLFLLGWISIDSMTHKPHWYGKNDPLTNKITPFLLLIVIYGLITAVTKTNPILDSVGLEGRFNMEMGALESVRSFRVSGANISCSVYGLACSILFLLSFFLLKNKTKLQLAVSFLLLLNVLVTTTRAAIITCFIGIGVFLLMEKGTRKTIQYVLTSIIVIFILFAILPNDITAYFNEIFLSIADIFWGSGGSDYGGSSIEGRDIQIYTSLEFLKEKPFFGHGFGYASDVLMQGEKHTELLGMESYICFIGIEFGLVYAAVLITFFVSCIIYYIKNRRYSPTYSNMGIALVVSYIIYLIYAWVGFAWFYIMPILGYITKTIYLDKQKTLQRQIS